MMFPRTPPRIIPMVTTEGAAVRFIWRLVIVWSALITCALTTMGSTPPHGLAP